MHNQTIVEKQQIQNATLTGMAALVIVGVWAVAVVSYSHKLGLIK